MTTWNLPPLRPFHPADGEGGAPSRLGLARWRHLFRLLPRGWHFGYHPEKRYMRGGRPGA